MDYRDETIEKEDFYQMYLDDLSEITPCTEAERENCWKSCFWERKQLRKID